MKTPEEIKKGLGCCARGNRCRRYCPYDSDDDDIYECTSELSRDALAYIQQLEAQLVNQATEYSQALKITTEQRDMLMGTQDKLAALLSYVTGGRFSKTSYSIDEMERFVDDYQQSECAKCDELEQVKVERDAVPQWISVKERLPETDDYCIVFEPGYGCEVCMYYGDGEWLTTDLSNVTRFVSHWMPLPVPPEEET